ncbi:MAG: peptide chain release factor 1, partial [Frankiaceae bacterium]|nr:peptide chain release factor 1 [Frankiaceae bacterium]
MSASAPTDLLSGVLAEHADLEHAMQDPTIHNDQNRARSLGQRYAELTPIVETAKELQAVEGDLAAAREFVKDDESFRDELDSLAEQRDALTEKLRRLLLPTDPHDAKDVILEIKAGEGGEESALFAGDLLRMYLRFAERNGLKTEILDTNESDLGGFKDVTVVLRSRKGADGAWSQLK